MHEYARLAQAARALAPLVEAADLGSSVRSLARGRGVAFEGVPDAVMLVRELLAALDVPPRGPASNRPLATMALDLVTMPRRSLLPAETTWGELFTGVAGGVSRPSAESFGSAGGAPPGAQPTDAGTPPLYPPARHTSAAAAGGFDLLRARWSNLRRDLHLPYDDAALEEVVARSFHPVGEAESLVLPPRAERLLLRDHGPRHDRHAELDVEEVRATLHLLDFDLVSLTAEPGRLARVWLRPGAHHASGVSLTIEGALRSVYFTVHAEQPDELVRTLEGRFQTESYDELLRDVALSSRDDETFARAVLRMALGAPHHEEPRALTVFDEAFHSSSAGARGAAVIGAGLTRWLSLHDPVVRQKGDDDATVRELAERIAPSLDPTLEG